MTSTALDRALQVFTRRQPFRVFLLEFVTGDRVSVTHPELIMRWDDYYVFRAPGGHFRLFGADSVCQLLELPVDRT